MNADTRLLLRYVDREMSAGEAEQFRARLSDSPELCRQLQQMQELGVMIRRWSTAVEPRGGELLDATLRRVRVAESQRQRRSLGYGLLAMLRLAYRASGWRSACPD